MNDELLIKFLLKEASPEEDQYVHDWLKQSHDNRKKLKQLKTIWDTSKELAQEYPVDEEAAWKRFSERKDRTQRLSEVVTPTKTISIPMRTTSIGWLKIAASIVITLGLLITVYWYTIAPKHPYFNTTEFATTTTTLTETLPDGTHVTLNKHSKIAYQERLFGSRRLVKMSGEVFFDVASDVSKPFEVQTKDIAVCVLGTSFNIKSNSEATEVIVETGAVQVSRNDVVIKLKPDEKAIARVGLATLEQEKQTDKLYDYYRSKRFKLDNTPLWRFVEVLNEVYPVKIIISDPAIGYLPINTTFDNDSLNNILGTLRDMLQVHIERNGKTITIKK